jgi:hypothetical protein
VRSLYLFILMFYFASQLGFSLSKHYCLGMLKEVELFAYAHQSCCCAISKSLSQHDAHNNCCQHQQEYVKLTQDQNTSFITYDFSNNPILLFNTQFPVFLDHKFQPLSTREVNYDHLQPKLGSVPFFILFHELKLPDA